MPDCSAKGNADERFFHHAGAYSNTKGTVIRPTTHTSWAGNGRACMFLGMSKSIGCSDTE